LPPPDPNQHPSDKNHIYVRFGAKLQHGHAPALGGSTQRQHSAVWDCHSLNINRHRHRLTQAIIVILLPPLPTPTIIQKQKSHLYTYASALNYSMGTLLLWAARRHAALAQRGVGWPLSILIDRDTQAMMVVILLPPPQPQPTSKTKITSTYASALDYSMGTPLLWAAQRRASTALGFTPNPFVAQLSESLSLCAAVCAVCVGVRVCGGGYWVCLGL